MNFCLLYQKLIYKLKFFLFLIVLIPLLKINAQTGDPYSKTNLEINFLKSKPSEFLGKYWNSDFGLQGLISTTFYAGQIQAGVNYYSFSGKEENYPAFKGFFIFAGWGNEISLPLRLTFFSAIRAGTFLMHFNVDTLSAFNNFESELAVNLNAVLKYRITEFLNLHAGGEFTAVFLHNKIKLLTAFAGLEYSFTSPVWLKEFFE
jgi:hypothetical protein